MNTSNTGHSPTQTGSLAVLGTALAVTGAFYLLISALGTASLITVRYDASTLIGRVNLRNAVEAFLILQVFAGWILGPFTILGWSSHASRRIQKIPSERRRGEPVLLSNWHHHRGARARRDEPKGSQVSVRELEALK